MGVVYLEGKGGKLGTLICLLLEKWMASLRALLPNMVIFTKGKAWWCVPKSLDHA